MLSSQVCRQQSIRATQAFFNRLGSYQATWIPSVRNYEKTRQISRRLLLRSNITMNNSKSSSTQYHLLLRRWQTSGRYLIPTSALDLGFRNKAVRKNFTTGRRIPPSSTSTQHHPVHNRTFAPRWNTTGLALSMSTHCAGSFFRTKDARSHSRVSRTWLELIRRTLVASRTEEWNVDKDVYVGSCCRALYWQG